jgi:predicted lipoprotein
MKKIITTLAVTVTLITPTAAVASTGASLEFAHPDLYTVLNHELKLVNRAMRHACSGPRESAQGCAEEIHEAQTIIAKIDRL